MRWTRYSRLGVTGGCEDRLSATDGLPPAADAPLQRGEMAKSARFRHSDRRGCLSAK